MKTAIEDERSGVPATAAGRDLEGFGPRGGLVETTGAAESAGSQL